MIRFNTRGSGSAVLSVVFAIKSRRHQVLFECYSSSHSGVAITTFSNKAFSCNISAGCESVDGESDAEIERWYLAWKESVELARCMQPASGSETKIVRL